MEEVEEKVKKEEGGRGETGGQGEDEVGRGGGGKGGLRGLGEEKGEEESEIYWMCIKIYGS